MSAVYIAPTPFQSLNQAFRKVKPLRGDVVGFAERLLQLMDVQQANLTQKEDWHENEIRDALKELLGAGHYVNKKGHIDVAVHEIKSAKSPVALLIEAKRPSNTSEFIGRADERTSGRADERTSGRAEFKRKGGTRANSLLLT